MYWRAVRKKLMAQNLKSAPGLDKISQAILKCMADFLCRPRTSIFKKYQEEGLVPRNLSLSSKGSRSAPANKGLSFDLCHFQGDGVTDDGCHC